MGLPEFIEELGRFEFLSSPKAQIRAQDKERALEAETHQEVRYCYILLYLRTPELPNGCRLRLEKLGVECISEGAYFQAYAVVPDSESFCLRLELDPDIVHIEKSEPASGK